MKGSATWNPVMTTKILIIDDDPLNIKLVKSRLEASNYEVVTAMDGEEGLQKVNQDKPDLIILDDTITTASNSASSGSITIESSSFILI